ncbi:MAG: polysaccharide biosynthesis C-terminal domain-containing protein [Bacteroidota bacterium]
MLKKLLSHSAIYGLAPQLPQVANLFILPIITQDLTTTDYGVAGVVYAYLAALEAFQFLGLRLSLSNGYFHHKMQYKWLWRQIHGFVSLWSILFAVIVGLILYVGIPDEAVENRPLIILLHIIPIILFNVSSECGRLYYQLSQNPVPLAVQVALVGFIMVFMNLYLISYQQMGYMGWFWSRFTGAFISFLFFFYPLYIKRKLIPIFNFKWRLIKEKLKLALPMIPHSYGSYLLHASDRVVLDLLQVNVSRIGIYNLAGNFGNYFNAFVNGSGMAADPMIAEYYKNLPRKTGFSITRDFIFLWQVLILIFSFLVCLWFKEIFSILIRNDELQEAYALAIIVIMSYNYRPLYAGFTTKLFYYEKTDKLWRISFGAGVINVLLNLAFIPFFGIEAAAISTFISFLLLGILGYYLKEYKAMEDENYFPLLWALGISLCTLVVFYLKDIFWAYKISISLVILGASLYWAIKNKAFLQNFDLQEQLNKINQIGKN